MRRMPLSNSDQWLGTATDGLEVPLGDRSVGVRIRSVTYEQWEEGGHTDVEAVGRA